MQVGRSEKDQDREARNAEHRGEVASLQASPRQTMSTNTLRMVNEP
jgi:hypothetical protein